MPLSIEELTEKATKILEQEDDIVATLKTLETDDQNWLILYVLSNRLPNELSVLNLLSKEEKP
jgi:methyltransferase-like protein